MDSFSCATAATLEHQPLCVLDDHRIQDGCPKSVNDPPVYCVGAAGVLRYNRASDSHRLNLTTILPESLPLTEYPVKCEYCGEQVRPSLDLTWLQEPERAPVFCCAQWQQLCEMLVKQRCLLEGRDDLRTGTPTSQENKPAADTEELLIRDRGMEDYNKFVLDLASGLGILPEPKTHDYSIQLPVTETFAPTSKVLSFRLSCAAQKGCWTVYHGATTDKWLQIDTEGEQALVPFCEQIPRQFGICHHQDGAEFLQKFYSNGMKFLTAFPDGSAQVFYPSGLLAVVVVVTEENGRVCIVYEDSNAPNRPIRAVFQSDGRATCYHSNGNIWLSLNKSGGQCLDEVGARVRRWCWSSMNLTTTSLHPVFLSLNKTVGVRVLGKDQVFVSFLASGQQTRFCVGTSYVKGESKTDKPASGLSLLKDDLLVLAARIRIRLAIQDLHQYLKTPSYFRVPKVTQSPNLQVVAQRLLEVSAYETMSEHDRHFIRRCLQDLMSQ